MGYSKLVSYIQLSPNYSKRTGKISKITIHHAAGVNATLKGMGNIFSKPSRQASSNYGIDSQGNIALYVDEDYRAWTSSSKENDNVAVTIEVANSTGAPNWEVSAKAYAALIDLCVDICKRNGIKALEYTGDKTGNLTRHNMFAATACPGPYLQGKFSEIATKVNAQLGAVVAPQPNVLTKGDKGTKVKALQENLIKLGYNLGGYGADGDFGSATQAAVKKFQKNHGLQQDGIVGAQTLAEIDAALKVLNNKSKYTEKQFIEDVQRCLGAGVDGIAGPITLGKTITVSASKNRKHPVVKYIQKRLYSLGYASVGEADGVAGSKFTAALKAFQKANGCTADGEATAKQKTWKKLLGM